MSASRSFARGRTENSGKAPFIAIGVAQEGDAVAAFDRHLALALDIARDHILGSQQRRVYTARSFRAQDIAIAQNQRLALHLEIGGERGHGKALRGDRLFANPSLQHGDLDLRNESLALRGRIGGSPG